MMTMKKKLSPARIHRVKCQGYSGYSDIDVSRLAFGNRFPVILCFIMLVAGVALANIPVLLILLVISFLGVLLPYHIFDYIYNYGLRGFLDKPILPPRSNQFKFACSVATLWNAINIYLFASGLMTAGYISGTIMCCVPLLLITTDYCIPSVIYNFLFRIKIV